MEKFINNALLVKNTQWQGGNDIILQKGSQILAQELFSSKDYISIKEIEDNELKVKNNILALDSLALNFSNFLDELEKNQESKIFTVGATCDLDIAPVSYLNKLYENKIAIVWLDAHGDLNTAQSSPSKLFHGMGLRTLLNEGPKEFCEKIQRPIKAEQIFFSGIRDLDKEESTYIKENNIKVSKLQNIVKDIKAKGFEKVYIHLDVDVINPNSFDEMLMPTSGGPCIEDISKAIYEINTNFELVGFCIVEFCAKTEKAVSQLKGMLSKANII